MKYTPYQSEKKVPRWVYNELKYMNVPLHDRTPGAANKNEAERSQIERDYQGV